jgi:nitrite reductase/ring-hydroxylating ferredoxin subunit
MGRLVRVAETKDVPPGTAIAVDVEGQAVALFNLTGTLYAIDDTCTHRGGPLSQGEVNGMVVTCPFHGARFDVTTGWFGRQRLGEFGCHDVRVSKTSSRSPSCRSRAMARRRRAPGSGGSSAARSATDGFQPTVGCIKQRGRGDLTCRNGGAALRPHRP